MPLKNLLVFGGKGGVGKSSISCATAAHIADKLPDQKVLLISFDIAHNLSDIFKMEIGTNMTQITENLWAIEPNPEIFAEKYTQALMSKIQQLIQLVPLVGMIPELKKFLDETVSAKTIPLALKNAFFFQSILDADHPMDWLSEKETMIQTPTQEIPSFDVIVADMPPTGNMVALFEVPEDTVKHLLKYSLEMVSTIQDFMSKFRKISKAVNPLSWLRSDKSKEDQKNIAKDILKLLHDMEQRGTRISDIMKGIGSLRLVTIAEKPSIEEIKRAWELSKPYITLDALNINRLIPPELGKESIFLQKQINLQQKYMKIAEQDFTEFKIFKSKYLDEEPIGLDGILKLAREAYKDVPIEDVLNPSHRKLINPEFKPTPIKENVEPDNSEGENSASKSSESNNSSQGNTKESDADKYDF